MVGLRMVSTVIRGREFQMAQYRKKPAVVDAEQFFYDGPRVRGVFYPDVSEDGRTWIGDAFVITIHDQRVYLQSGDWIIAEPDGEHYYPVKPNIFAATYEQVEGDMFARGEMASSPATPGIEPTPTESESQEFLYAFSRLQSEHSDLIENERVLEAENATLRRQLAEAQAKCEQMESFCAVHTEEDDTAEDTMLVESGLLGELVAEVEHGNSTLVPTTGVEYIALKFECDELRWQRNVAIAELADLRRQLAETQRANWQLEQDGQAAREEAADLRRQLAECQTEAERYKAKFQEMEGDWLAERKQVQIITEDRDYVSRLLVEAREQMDQGIEEYNAGWVARRRGQPISAEPANIREDEWVNGWIVADYWATHNEAYKNRTRA